MVPLDWQALDQLIKPSPGYEVLVGQLLDAFTYNFVAELYNMDFPAAARYATELLGKDPRQRYNDWLASLLETFRKIEATKVGRTLDFLHSVETREKLEDFAAHNGIEAVQLIQVLKYLLNRVIPGKLYLRELIETDREPDLEYVTTLRKQGVRFNLDLIEAGRAQKGRQALAVQMGVPLAFLQDLVHRADFTRMPYTRGNSVRNFFNAGYDTLGRLASADLERLTEAMLRFGKSAGKNLKIGMEMDSAIQSAQVIPKAVED